MERRKIEIQKWIQHWHFCVMSFARHFSPALSNLGKSSADF